MDNGFEKSSKSFVGLSVNSTYADFQAYFYNAGMHRCPRPCLPQEEPCVKFGPRYPGMEKVKWVRSHGMVEHPERYPELSLAASSDKEIANTLYMHGVRGCERVCDDDEEEGHFVAQPDAGDAPLLSEGWMTTREPSQDMYFYKKYKKGVENRRNQSKFWSILTSGASRAISVAASIIAVMGGFGGFAMLTWITFGWVQKRLSSSACRRPVWCKGCDRCDPELPELQEAQLYQTATLRRPDSDEYIFEI